MEQLNAYEVRPGRTFGRDRRWKAGTQVVLNPDHVLGLEDVLLDLGPASDEQIEAYRAAIAEDGEQEPAFDHSPVEVEEVPVEELEDEPFEEEVPEPEPNIDPADLETDLESVLEEGLAEQLKDAGFVTVYDVRSASDASISRVPGVGKVTLRLIRDALPKYEE